MYKVLAATRQDLNEGWVWLTNSGLESRSVVKIKNRKNGKLVYCECLEIDNNFVHEYNSSTRRIKIDPSENTLIINEWYRKKLGGLQTKSTHDLELKPANGWWGKIRTNIGHPQVVVRMATWLALLSVGLGLVGFCLGMIGVCLSIN
jgi:hypothetical protein